MKPHTPNCIIAVTGSDCNCGQAMRAEHERSKAEGRREAEAEIVALLGSVNANGPVIDGYGEIVFPSEVLAAVIGLINTHIAKADEVK